MQRPLTERILNSSFECTIKCYLLLQGRHGTRTEYETHANDFDRKYQREAISRLQNFDPNNETLHLKRLPSSAPHNGSLMVIKRGDVDGLQSDAIVLSRPSQGEALTPVFFHRYEDISTKAKLLLAFRAIVVGKATGIVPTHGKVIYGREFAHSRILLTTFIAKTENIIHGIRELSNQKSPPLFLCSHCEICEFRQSCRSRAIEEDNISLLEGIGRNQVEEQHRRGIFTLHQYSHTFRSRRTPKRAKNPATPRYFALQARALRDKKVYIHGKAELPVTAASIFFDFEGIPGRRFHYLFGMLIVTDTVSYQSFWANDESEQVGAFVKFCEALAAYSDTAFFHYGDYELKVFKKMKGCMASQYDALIDRILGSCHNILSVIHRHCYFPTHSNRLKDVAGFLGYQFDNAINSGLRSVIFRERWESTADDSLKDELVRYNRQDCEALKTIRDFLTRSSRPLTPAAYNSLPNGTQDVVFTDSLRKVGEGNRPVFRKAEFAYPEFEIVNKCAYFDYQRNRVFAREQRLSRVSSAQSGPKTKRRRSLATEVSQIAKNCSACGSRKIVCEKRFVRWVIDLKYYKTRIGVKRWQPRYLLLKYRCRGCGKIFISPNVPFTAGSRTIYGHGLMCWCVYHNLVGKQSMLSLHRGLQDIFNMNIPSGKGYHFKSILADYYRELSGEILEAILEADVLHVDETPVKLRKTTGYVWVVSSSSEVCYIFKESREGSFVQELLGDYQGVLVSDFFTAYDSLKCRQQKCLIHLMRDMNDDLRKDPYDQEMRSIAEPFARLLKEIVLTIDRYGLRRRHLHKYMRPAERLCTEIGKRSFTSPSASKYQNRFAKYGDRLFTFLNYDAVPWNNNNAEHAVHHFAKLRRFTDGTFTKSSIEQLLILLTVIQTCEYRKVNALRFLLSGKRRLREMNDAERSHKSGA